MRCHQCTQPWDFEHGVGGHLASSCCSGIEHLRSGTHLLYHLPSPLSLHNLAHASPYIREAVCQAGVGPDKFSSPLDLRKWARNEEAAPSLLRSLPNSPDCHQTLPSPERQQASKE